MEEQGIKVNLRVVSGYGDGFKVQVPFGFEVNKRYGFGDYINARYGSQEDLVRMHEVIKNTEPTVRSLARSARGYVEGVLVPLGGGVFELTVAGESIKLQHPDLRFVFDNYDEYEQAGELLQRIKALREDYDAATRELDAKRREVHVPYWATNHGGEEE